MTSRFGDASTLPGRVALTHLHKPGSLPDTGRQPVCWHYRGTLGPGPARPEVREQQRSICTPGRGAETRGHPAQGPSAEFPGLTLLGGKWSQRLCKSLPPAWEAWTQLPAGQSVQGCRDPAKKLSPTAPIRAPLRGMPGSLPLKTPHGYHPSALSLISA